MESYQERLIKEREELMIKIRKLEAFSSSDDFSALENSEKELLKKQLDIMHEYDTILFLRIK